MDLRSKMAGSLERFFSKSGSDSVYTPLSGSAVPCKIFIEFEVRLQPALDGQTWEEATVITARLAEIGKEPTRGETFLYDETSYTVQKVIENDGLTVQVAVI